MTSVLDVFGQHISYTKRTRMAMIKREEKPSDSETPSSKPTHNSLKRQSVKPEFAFKLTKFDGNSLFKTVLAQFQKSAAFSRWKSAEQHAFL